MAKHDQRQLEISTPGFLFLLNTAVVKYFLFEWYFFLNFKEDTILEQ